ncbi:MAG: pyrroline-5-carboxylate reductase [Alphaproteobacteria bacterium]
MELISKQNPLLLLGCGKMGYAMLSGWLNSGICADDIHIIDTNTQNRKKLEPLGVHLHNSMEDFSLKASVILLAIKPQSLDKMRHELISLAAHDNLVISIAAGKSLSWLQESFHPHQPIIRTMPNTPSQVKKGITAFYGNKFVSPEQKNVCIELLKAIGSVIELENETQMDAVTALSGGGPAWVFLLTEAMTKAGTELGLSHDMAAQLARKTIEGAAALMEAESKTPPDSLRKNVTSPGGTTIEAINILNGDDGWQKIINKAMSASAKRSQELS